MPLLDRELLENESAVRLANAALGTESVQQIVQIIRRRHSGAKTEIERAGEVEALDDSPIVCNELEDRLTVSAIGEPHVNGCLDRFAESGMVDDGFEAHDDLAVDQALKPRTRSIGA